MTVSTSTNREQFEGNGSATTFSFSFKLLATGDVTLTHVDTSVDPQVETTLVEGTDYSVTLASDGSGFDVSFPLGGSSFSTLAANEYLVGVREVDYDQQTNIRNQGGFLPEVVETAFDKLTMLVQQVLNIGQRSLRLSDADTAASPDMTLPVDRASKYLMFDSDGNPAVAAFGGTLSDIDSVNNIAALRSITPTSETRVYVKAHTSEGDGGHGVFRGITGAAASTYTDDGGVTIVPTGGDGSSAWVREVSGFVTPGMFGAVADNTTDDSGALSAWISYCATAGVKGVGCPEDSSNNVFFISSQIELAADDLTIEFIGGVYIRPDTALLEPVVIGSNSSPSRMVIKGLAVDRGTYNGATENVGILWRECNQSVFENIESRFSKYPHKFAPSTAGLGYNTFVNCQAIGGYYNFWLRPSGTGWVNENDFLGGRGFCTTNTNTNFRIDPDTGGEAGHNRVSMSLEGQGVQGIYDNGNSNQFVQCRSEGTWSGGYFHVCGTNCEYPLIISGRYDYTVDYSSASRPTALTYTEGLNVHTALNNKRGGKITREGANPTAPGSGGVPALEIRDEYSSSGYSQLLDMYHGRDGDTSYAFRSIRASDGLVRASLTTNGKFTVAQQLKSEQSSYSFEPLALGSYVLWIDSSGRLRIKSGTPASETDGTVVGTQT